MIYGVSFLLRKKHDVTVGVHYTVHASSTAEAVGMGLLRAMEVHPDASVVCQEAEVIEEHPLNADHDGRYYSPESQWLVLRLQDRTREQVEAILDAAESLPYDEIFKDGHTV